MRLRTLIGDWPTRNLQISPERGLTSTLRLDCHKRALNGRGTRRANDLLHCLRQQRHPTLLQLLLPRYGVMTVASPLSSAILLMKMRPPYRTQSATQI